MDMSYTYTKITTAGGIHLSSSNHSLYHQWPSMQMRLPRHEHFTGSVLLRCAKSLCSCETLLHAMANLSHETTSITPRPFRMCEQFTPDMGISCIACLIYDPFHILWLQEELIWGSVDWLDKDEYHFCIIILTHFKKHNKTVPLISKIISHCCRRKSL